MDTTEKNIKVVIQEDLEAARQIDQALTNLPKDYPYRDLAQRAFGRLILGRLGLKPKSAVIHIPSEDSGEKWCIIDYEA